MKILIVAAILLSQSVFAKDGNFETVRKNSPVVKGLPIKCSGNHYGWIGMLKEEGGKHAQSVKKATNTTPLETIILEKKGRLMVDNDEWKILRSNKDETWGIYLDDNNLLSIVLNYNYGTLLYTKVFNNADFGKQNTMSFIANCVNN